MHIRITSVVSEEVAACIREITVTLEDALNLVFKDRNYGANVGRFMAVVVAVDSDVSENERFCKAYNKVGSDKNPITSERVKRIGFALPFDPAAIEAMTEEQVRMAICKALMERIKNPGLKIPKEFDYAKFSSDLEPLLEIFSRVTFIEKS